MLTHNRNNLGIGICDHFSNGDTTINDPIQNLFKKVGLQIGGLEINLHRTQNKQLTSEWSKRVFTFFMEVLESEKTATSVQSYVQFLCFANTFVQL